MKAKFVLILTLALATLANAQTEVASPEAAVAQAVPAIDLLVSITDTRNQEGSVLISVFNDSEAFPKDADRAVAKLKLSVAEAASFTVPALAPGEYAIAIAHDENNNGKVDTNVIGIPKEGFGFSKNAMGTFGPPSWKKAKITVSAEAASTQIKMKYF